MGAYETLYLKWTQYLGQMTFRARVFQNFSPWLSFSDENNTHGEPEIEFRCDASFFVLLVGVETRNVWKYRIRIHKLRRTQQGLSESKPLCRRPEALF